MERLPNYGQPTQTTATKLIDFHYSNLLLVRRWTWDRYVRLAAYLKMTEYELASLATLTHKEVPKFRRENRITRSHAQSVCLILTILEHHVAGQMAMDTVANPFPNLSGVEAKQDA